MVDIFKKYGRITIGLVIILVVPRVCLAKYFVKAKISKETVYPMEPTVLYVSVYTSTWFTRSADLYDLQLKNSFTIRTGRPQSSYQNINGRRYNVQTFAYQIFPLREGRQEIPSLKISFATPPEGQYKGKEVSAKTNTLTYNVTSIPQSYSYEDWIVANKIKLTRTISPKKKKWHVGEVITETIRIDTKGTLASLVPTIKHDTINWGTIYNGEVSRGQKVTEDDISSYIIQTTQYLIEKPGKHKVGALKIGYYSPTYKKTLKTATKALNINAISNHNLQKLEALQDSLQKQNLQAKGATIKEEPKWYKKFNWIKGLYITITLLIVVQLWKIMRKWHIKLKQKITKFTRSESYLFIKVITTFHIKSFYLRMDQWLQCNERIKKVSVHQLFEQEIMSKWKDDYMKLCEFLFNNGNSKQVSLLNLKIALIKWRNHKTKNNKKNTTINPS
ncbi:BatD family protein [Halosquirtibacter laminarini]|uniref:BatD family protein n=1 Tax=Halosquirtibacter laminarini TaxID=3374600 RepID=A0AC61NEF7_9BACT|nr:BatD family protein [Prolixibacteraceae bacterium]